MPAMATNFASETGGLTDHLINYYKERAKGGVGLIIIENTTIDFPLGTNGAIQIRLDQDRFIPGLSRLVDEVHENGAKVAIQINHCGGLTSKSKTRGLQPVSCSPKICKLNGEIPRELTVSEIQEIIKKFGEAALRAEKAGFDAVEIHGGHGYLIAQFMSPYNNQRQDEYGCGLSGRIKFPLDIINEIRKKVGSSFPLIFRISAEEFIRGGRKIDETLKIVKILEESGINALNITLATGFNMTKQIEPITYPQGWRIHYARTIKEVVNLPVITVGVIREPEFAEDIIKRGDADFVAIGRGLIADPFWPEKAFVGKEEEICKCISCNDGCINNRGFKDLPICCSVNPAVGREKEYNSFKKTNIPKKIVVIGGGPAGMETARVARLKGHKVILFEKDDKLGGQMLLAAKPPNKEKIKWFINYLINQITILKVDVRLNTLINKADFLDEIRPDFTIIAVGSKPVLPNISGIVDTDFIMTAQKLLSDDIVLKNKNIVVIGGGLVGCETAEFLEENDNQVTIIEMLENIAMDVNPIYREDIIERLGNSSIKIFGNTRLDNIRIKEKKLELKGCFSGKSFLIPCDMAILACGAKPNFDLANLLLTKTQRVYLAGDCDCPGKILDAVASGSKTARMIN